MVNVCGKCKYFERSETTQDGEYFYYCSKAEELFPLKEQPDTQDGEPQEDEQTEAVPVLQLKFNDVICSFYTKKRN